MKLSVVVPCYNEENNVHKFYDACKTAFDGRGFEYEIIFVNDGSYDDTWTRLLELQKTTDRVSLINLSRNFGNEAAMYAGLKRSRGEFVSVVDADLQQPPRLVNDMLDFLEENRSYDAVAMYQEQRKEGKINSCLKNGFYKLSGKLLNMEFKNGASDFRTLRRRVVEELLKLPEQQRFSKGLFSWVGFSTYYMPYVAEQRNSGSSSWSRVKLFKYAIKGMAAFSTLPLRISSLMGGLSSVIAVIYMIVVFFEHYFTETQFPGYATIVFLILFIGGIQMLMLGIIGEYIAQIFIESKNRPLYIEKDYVAAASVLGTDREKE